VQSTSPSHPPASNQQTTYQPSSVVITSPGQAYSSQSTVYTKYRSAQSRGLGITQIIVGALCIVLNVLAIVFESIPSIIGFGIWGGILVIIAGSFGITAAKHRTRCHVIASMVLSIISAALTIGLFIVSILAAVLDGVHCYMYYSYNSDGQRVQSLGLNECMNRATVSKILNAALAVLAVVEAVAAIWSSVLGCKAACCCSYTPYAENVVVIPGQVSNGPGVQMIMITQPQTNANVATAYPGYSIVPQQQGSQLSPLPPTAAPNYYDCEANSPNAEGLGGFSDDQPLIKGSM